jgi:hypothetical protein
MIKLMNNQQVYTSPEYSHPQQTGENSITYILAHNFGKQPDKIILYVKNSVGQYCEKYDYNYYPPESKGYGFAIDKTQCTINATAVQLYNVGGSGNQTIIFRCFNLGTTQTITNITPAFQWSSSEQVYPFERDIDGRTLYCKEVNMGTLASNGAVSVAHNIPNYDPTKIHKIEGIARATSSYDDYSTFQLGLAGWTGIQTGVVLKVYISNIIVFTPASYYNNYTGVVRIIYAK